MPIKLNLLIYIILYYYDPSGIGFRVGNFDLKNEDGSDRSAIIYQPCSLKIRDIVIIVDAR